MIVKSALPPTKTQRRRGALQGLLTVNASVQTLALRRNVKDQKLPRILRLRTTCRALIGPTLFLLTRGDLY